nr:uncharacterized protein LOC128698883 [Cherax quadricarinatus]
MEYQFVSQRTRVTSSSFSQRHVNGFSGEVYKRAHKEALATSDHQSPRAISYRMTGMCAYVLLLSVVLLVSCRPELPPPFLQEPEASNISNSSATTYIETTKEEKSNSSFTSSTSVKESTTFIHIPSTQEEKKNAYFIYSRSSELMKTSVMRIRLAVPIVLSLFMAVLLIVVIMSIISIIRHIGYHAI